MGHPDEPALIKDPVLQAKVATADVGDAPSLSTDEMTKFAEAQQMGMKRAERRKSPFDPPEPNKVDAAAKSVPPPTRTSSAPAPTSNQTQAQSQAQAQAQTQAQATTAKRAVPTVDPAERAEAIWSKSTPILASPEVKREGARWSNTVPAPSTPEDQLIELAGRMAALLRSDTTAKTARISDAAALAPIESMRPGALAELDSLRSTLGQALSAGDRRTLLEARDRLAAQPADSNPLASRVLAGQQPALKITRAVLCAKVSGFGNYIPLASSTFVAGQPIHAVVYAEIENFATRPAVVTDRLVPNVAADQQVSVDLSQALTLYQDPGGLMAWHMPLTPTTDTCLARRRDFYVVCRVELPRTLTIGRYNLKVMIKDRTSNAEAEALMPIVVVAQ